MISQDNRIRNEFKSYALGQKAREALKIDKQLFTEVIVSHTNYAEVEVNSGGYLLSTTFTDTEVNNCFSVYHTN